MTKVNPGEEICSVIVPMPATLSYHARCLARAIKKKGRS
jgi:hypothetical protein